MEKHKFIYKKYKSEKYFHVIYVNLDDIYRLNLSCKLFYVAKE